MSDQDDGDWAEQAKRHGVNPQQVMQRAAAQMQRESAAARARQEHAGGSAAPPPEVWIVIEQKAPQRWKATSVGPVGGRMVEAYGMTEHGASGPQFRYMLAHVLQAAEVGLAWDDARAAALRYRVHVAEVKRLKG